MPRVAKDGNILLQRERAVAFCLAALEEERGQLGSLASWLGSLPACVEHACMRLHARCIYSFALLQPSHQVHQSLGCIDARLEWVTGVCAADTLNTFMSPF